VKLRNILQLLQLLLLKQQTPLGLQVLATLWVRPTPLVLMDQLTMRMDPKSNWENKRMGAANESNRTYHG